MTESRLDEDKYDLLADVGNEFSLDEDQQNEEEEDIIKSTLGYEDEEDEFEQELRQYEEQVAAVHTADSSSFRVESPRTPQTDENRTRSSCSNGANEEEFIVPSKYTGRLLIPDDDEEDEDEDCGKRLRFESERDILAQRKLKNVEEKTSKNEGTRKDHLKVEKNSQQRSNNERRKLTNRNQSEQKNNRRSNQSTMPGKILLNPHFKEPTHMFNDNGSRAHFSANQFPKASIFPEPMLNPMIRPVLRPPIMMPNCNLVPFADPFVPNCGQVIGPMIHQDNRQFRGNVPFPLNNFGGNRFTPDFMGQDPGPRHNNGRFMPNGHPNQIPAGPQMFFNQNHYQGDHPGMGMPFGVHGDQEMNSNMYSPMCGPAPEMFFRNFNEHHSRQMNGAFPNQAFSFDDSKRLNNRPFEHSTLGRVNQQDNRNMHRSKSCPKDNRDYSKGQRKGAITNNVADSTLKVDKSRVTLLPTPSNTESSNLKQVAVQATVLKSDSKLKVASTQKTLTNNSAKMNVAQVTKTTNRTIQRTDPSPDVTRPIKMAKIETSNANIKSNNSTPQPFVNSNRNLELEKELNIDEEYKKKVEEQKRKREEFIRLKEARRKEKLSAAANGLIKEQLNLNSSLPSSSKQIIDESNCSSNAQTVQNVKVLIRNVRQPQQGNANGRYHRNNKANFNRN